jgi:hypothetical protein
VIAKSNQCPNGQGAVDKDFDNLTHSTISMVMVPDDQMLLTLAQNETMIISNTLFL